MKSSGGSVGSMAQMSERAYKNRQAELQVVLKNLECSREEMRAAADAGDLRENTPYDVARDKVVQLTKQKMQLEAQLRDVEVVAEDIGPRITIGSLVEVCLVDAENKPLAEPRIFRLEEHGDTVIAGVLGMHSSLGSVILNGVSNYYDIPDNGGRRYRVTKKFPNGE